MSEKEEIQAYTKENLFNMLHIPAYPSTDRLIKLRLVNLYVAPGLFENE